MSKLNKDVLSMIFEELLDDKNSLYSLILVNRMWCEVAVPILWKDPWKNLQKNDKMRTLLEIIVSFLTNETRDSMRNRCLNLLIKSDKQPLFNYLSYCRCLDLSKLGNVIRTIQNIRSESKWSIISNEIFKLFINENSKITGLIIPSEFNHQIQLLPGFENCISKLEFLQCDDGSNQHILDRLAEVCKSITNLVIISKSMRNYAIIRIIKAQTKLVKVQFDQSVRNGDNSFYTSCGRALSKHANTIQHLQFQNIPGPLFANLNNLKSLELSSTFGGNLSWNNVETFSLPALQTFIANKVQSSFLSRFIKNRGTLVKIKISTDGILDSKFIQAIYQNCPNLKYLGLLNKNYDWLELEKLLINCQHLNGLIIDVSSANHDKLFEILIKSAPKNLFKFKIIHGDKINFRSLMSFLSHWKDQKDRYPMLFNMNHVTIGQLDLIEYYRIEGVIQNFHHEINGNYDFEWIM